MKFPNDVNTKSGPRAAGQGDMEMYICKRQCGELSHFWEKLQSQAQAVATVNSILIDRGPAQGTHGQEKTARSYHRNPFGGG